MTRHTCARSWRPSLQRSPSGNGLSGKRVSGNIFVAKIAKTCSLSVLLLVAVVAAGPVSREQHFLACHRMLHPVRWPVMTDQFVEVASKGDVQAELVAMVRGCDAPNAFSACRPDASGRLITRWKYCTYFCRSDPHYPRRGVLEHRAVHEPANKAEVRHHAGTFMTVATSWWWVPVAATTRRS
jgi:hypothetical protein